MIKFVAFSNCFYCHDNVNMAHGKILTVFVWQSYTQCKNGENFIDTRKSIVCYACVFVSKGNVTRWCFENGTWQSKPNYGQCLNWPEIQSVKCVSPLNAASLGQHSAINAVLHFCSSLESNKIEN